MIFENSLVPLSYSFDSVRLTLFSCNQGIAFCEYLDPAATDIAIESLNGMELGDKLMRVRRACVGTQQVSGLEMGVNAMSMLAGTTSQDMEEGRVLQLLNMVTAEELMDNDDYEGTLLCNRYFPPLICSSSSLIS